MTFRCGHSDDSANQVVKYNYTSQGRVPYVTCLKCHNSKSKLWYHKHKEYYNKRRLEKRHGKRVQLHEAWK